MGVQTEPSARADPGPEAAPDASTGHEAPGGPTPSLFEAAGGMPFFEALVARFYRGVEADPVLLPLYPQPHDLRAARRRLTLFLAQYWGGPTTYSSERGHPRLRGRHLAFAIGREAREHWLARMAEALDEMAAPPQIRARLDEYFVVAAEAMRNQE